MKPRPSIINRRSSLHGALAFGLLASLSLCQPALAGKGGGGKPGGGDGGDGGGDPPPDPAPVKYELSWVDLGGTAALWGINSSGVAVGYTGPEGAADRTAIVRFPDGEIHDLNEVLAAYLPTDPEPNRDWYLRLAWAITEDGLITGDLMDPDGGTHVFTVRLIDNGPGVVPTVESYQSLSGADLGAPAHTAPHRVLVHDVSTTSELVLRVNGESWDDGVTRTFAWTPDTGDLKGPFLEEFVDAAYYGARINSRSEILLPTEDRLIDAKTGFSQPIPLGSNVTHDIADDGTLIGGITGERVKVKGYGWATTYAAARYVNGSWEPISPFWPKTAQFWRTDAHHINGAGQIVGYSDGRCFLYADDGATGHRFLDDLIDPEGDLDALALWASLPNGLTFADVALNGISEPDASGFGWICGAYYLDGRNISFVLRPVVVP